MTDLRAALHAAAPAPAGEVDVAAIRARARRRRMRLVAWFAGLGVAVAAGVPGATSVLVSTSEGEPREAPGVPAEGDEVVGTDGERVGSGAADGIDPAGAEVTSGRRGPSGPPGPSVTSVTSVTSVLTSPPADGPTGRSPAVAPGPSNAYPLMPSCQVDSSGLEVGATRICRFTATAEGGAHMASDAPVWSTEAPSAYGEVIVTRGGGSGVVWDSQSSGVRTEAGDASVFAGGCGVLFIRPGDLVEVRLELRRSDPFTVTLAAGAVEQC